MNPLRQALLRERRRPRLVGGGSPTLHRGDGYEFVELREYTAGDDVRHVDWAATARTGTLQTRVLLEDVALTLAAILDNSASMQAGRNRPLADSARAIVDRWFAAAQRGDRTWLVTGSDLLPVWAAAEREFSLEGALATGAIALPKGAALLIVSDFYDLRPDDDVVYALGKRCDCTALIARDPWIDDLPLSGFLRVEDLESGLRAPLFFGRAERARFAAAAHAREEQLAQRLTDANWRVEFFREDDGEHALLRAFGIQ